MAISLYSGFVPVCLQLLGGLKTVLQKAEEHAIAQKWDTATVLNLRLYPDMFTLERQVRQVCNHALAAGRVAGVALPSLPDQDNSWAEMRSRIDKTVEFLKGLRPNQLDGKDDSDVTVPMGGPAHDEGAELSVSLLNAASRLPFDDRVQHPPRGRVKHRQARLSGPDAVIITRRIRS